MKLKSIHIKDFKRFSDLKISDIPSTVKLVLLTGPNGSGKTSLFDAFNFWLNCAKERYGSDDEYYLRVKTGKNHWSEILKKIAPEFHGGVKPIEERHRERKEFYIRSAFRHEADFTLSSLSRSESMLFDARRPSSLKEPEQRVSDNYQRIVSDAVNILFNKPEANQQTGEQIKERLIGEVRNAMGRVFSDLMLDGPGDPLSDGTFRFTKGNIPGFHYKNLSGGEKAAFDLLLDFIVKRQEFDDTIFCIDEPELHMHTKLQAKLLEVMFDLVTDNCQLWLSTHSIGMARKAAELNAANPGAVAFIDFHELNFDQPVRIQPIQPDRRFWQQMFHTALDDLAELVVPQYVVFCEGRKIGQPGKKPSFDAAIYRKIFSQSHPEIEFVPLGGGHEVQHDGKAFDFLLTQLAPGIKTWKIFDKDDRNTTEIAELKQEGIQVLGRRDIESYLWDDEVLQKLCEAHEQPDSFDEIKQEKQIQIQSLAGRGKPADDVKAITDSLYEKCKRVLNLHGTGNSAEAFSIEHLAPLIQPGMAVYEELAEIILAPLGTQN